MEQDSLTPTSVVAARVREMRSAKQWSAQRLAEEMAELGVDWNRGVVAKLETGRRESVSVAELMALACVFDVSPIALLLPSEAGDYAIAPNRVAGSTIRIIDWMLGRSGLPFGDQQDPSSGWHAIPAGLPQPLLNREIQLENERTSQMNELILRNGILEAEAKLRPVGDPKIQVPEGWPREATPSALLSLLERTERSTQEAEDRARKAEAARDRQAKLFRELARDAPAGVREEVMAIVTKAYLAAQADDGGDSE